MTDKQLVDALLSAHFGAFARKVFHTLLPGVQLQPNWHIEAMAHQLDRARSGEVKRLIINVPPRSLKSMLASVALPAFVLGHNPGARLICVSYSQGLSAKHSRDCRRILGEGWYRRIFPSTAISKDTEEILETTAGGYRLATSLEGTVTGFGGDFIIIDDPMKPTDASSQSALDLVIRCYRETLFSRLNSKTEGRIILVMQRLHEDDLAGHLIRDGGWRHLNLPATAVADEHFELGYGKTHFRREGDLLHPAREPKSALDELRRNLGSAAFHAQYEQSPVPADGYRVKKEWLKSYQIPPDRSGMRIAQSWDTANKGDPRSDYSVCTTWGMRNGHHYLLDVFRKQLDFPDLIRAVVSLHQEYGCRHVLIEDHASGTSLIQTLRQQYSIHPIPRRSKNDKETRLTIVSPMLEAGQVSLPAEAPWLAAFWDELLRFPRGRYDDQVDSMTQYLEWAQHPTRDVFEPDFGHDDHISHDEIARAMLHRRRG